MATAKVSILLPTTIEVEVNEELSQRYLAAQSRVNTLDRIKDRDAYEAAEDELYEIEQEVWSEIKREAHKRRDRGTVSDVQLILTYTFAGDYHEI